MGQTSDHEMEDPTDVELAQNLEYMWGLMISQMLDHETVALIEMAHRLVYSVEMKLVVMSGCLNYFQQMTMAQMLDDMMALLMAAMEIHSSVNL
jgi:hypothetical protein